MPAVATLRPPDISENNPNPAVNRLLRLTNFVNKQVTERVSLIAWIPNVPSSGPNDGQWGAWIDRVAPKIDALIEAKITIAPLIPPPAVP